MRRRKTSKRDHSHRRRREKKPKRPRKQKPGLVGRVQRTSGGFAFFLPENPKLDDVFMTSRAARPAMHGDRVEIQLEPASSGARRRGRVVRVLERATHRLAGVYHAGTRTGSISPRGSGTGYLVTVPPKSARGAREGDLVSADITRYPTARSDIECSITSILGRENDAAAETDAIVHAYGLPRKFPEAAVGAASRAVRRSDRAPRLDLTSLPLVTIDGDRARDFDDAIGIERLRQGRVRLTVAIADVGHFVPRAGPLDDEALERGTSVYLPDRVIPMLPEALSNDACSLRPRVGRLAQVVQMVVTKDGNVERTTFGKALIRTTARLTYTEVAAMLVDRDRSLRARHAARIEDLESMATLWRVMASRRTAHGAIDFDLPETEISVDGRGEPQSITRAPRTIAHRMVEEFMIAANEAVARHLTELGLPMLYRVHEPPTDEAVVTLRDFLEGLGLRIQLRAGRPTPRTYRDVLKAASGRPDERLVGRMLVRSLSQAHYAAANLGHFGLASKCYTHFTSPIRRYPDLVVHRILAASLEGSLPARERQRLEATLPEIAVKASERERRATAVERDVAALHKVLFMRDRVGDEFRGIVTDVATFGLFVELDDLLVEGLVPVGTLDDDFYERGERDRSLRGRRTGRTLKVGNPVVVKVVAASVERRQLDLSLVRCDPRSEQR